MHELCAIEALLALALLHEKVASAIPIIGKFSATCAVNALFRAAVGLKLWHRAKRV